MSTTSELRSRPKPRTVAGQWLSRLGGQAWQDATGGRGAALVPAGFGQTGYGGPLATLVGSLRSS